MFAASKTDGAVSAANYIEDVFSTYLYAGVSSGQMNINTGIDLAGKGGAVWIKSRGSSSYDNYLFSTATGGANAANSYLRTNTTAALDSTVLNASFTSTGFLLNANNGMSYDGAGFGTPYASWTFRKQPKFFDVVTYTGDGGTRTIPHNLGSTPGCIIIKETSGVRDWVVYHRSMGATQAMYLNTTSAAITSGSFWDNTSPTSTQFTVSFGSRVNTAGATYVAYLFAHDAGGFGLTGTDNVISCGSFTTDAGGAYSVSLGYEPQWVMIKRTDSTQNWLMFDNMRGLGVAGNSRSLFPNLSDAESGTNNFCAINATGFTGVVNASASYIYIAIRRGPMKTPTSGTSVFSPNAIGAVSVGTPVTTNFPVDLQIATWRGGTSSHYFYDRLRGVSSTTTEGAKSLISDSTAAETSPTTATRMWGNTGYQVDTSWSNSVSIFHNFRRAPGFFDEVCYDGTSVSTTAFAHNLKVKPEFIIVKCRNANGSWECYCSYLNGGTNPYLYRININSSSAVAGPSVNYWYQEPTASNFYASQNGNSNNLGSSYVAYLFASCTGVSKVGSYTGNGSTQTINCGFTGGARFVLIKRTDAVGDWYVYDTARGMTTLTDPYLLLNSTAAESATLGSVTTVSTGFALNAGVLAAINTNGASYIYLAIA